MNCRAFARTLYDYLDGTLADAEKAEFEHHRQICSRCAARLESEPEKARVLRAAVEEECQGLTFTLAPRPELIRSKAAARWGATRISPWRVAAAFAALLIVAILIPSVIRRTVKEGPPSPSTQTVAENHDTWAQEIEVTYETGSGQTTLISHESGRSTIIEIQVTYHPLGTDGRSR